MGSSIVDKLLVEVDVNAAALDALKAKSETAFKSVSDAGGRTGTAMSALNDILARISPTAAQAAAALEKTGGAFEKLAAGSAGLAGLSVGAVVALTAITVEAGRMAEEVERSFARVAAAVPTGEAGIDGLRDSLKQLSLASGESQVALAKLAEQAARTGATNAEDVASRVQAVVAAAAATGESADALFEPLNSLITRFNLSTGQAADALAAMFAAARGHESLTDLLEQLSGAAPSIGKLHLDLDTAARALVAIGDATGKPRQAAEVLKNLADAGAAGRAEIEKLANQIPKTDDAFEEMQTAAAKAENSVGGLARRLKEELSARLIDLGFSILNVAKPALEKLVELLDQSPTIKGAGAVQQAAQNIVDLAQAATDAGNPLAGLSDNAHKINAALDGLNNAVLAGERPFATLTNQSLAVLRDRLKELAASPNFTDRLQEVQALIRAVNTQMAQNVAPNAPRATGIPTLPTTAELAAQQKEVAGSARALRDLEQAFQDVFDRVSRGDITLADFTKAQRELGDRSDDLVAHMQELHEPTTAAQQDIATLTTRLTALRPAVEELAFQRFADSIRTATAALTGSKIDDLVEGTTQQIKAFKAVIATLPIEFQGLAQLQLGFFVNAAAAAVDTRTKMESLVTEMKALGSPETIGGIAQAQAAIDRIDQLLIEAQRDVDAAQTPDARAQFEQKINELLQKRAAVQNDIATITTRQLEATDRLAQSLEAAVSAGVQLAEAFFQLPEATGNALRDMVALVGQAGSFKQKFSTFSAGTTDAQGNAVVTGAQLIGLAVPLVGTITSLFQQFTQQSPEQQQQLAALRENSQRLAELNRGIAKVTLSISPSTAETIATTTVDAQTARALVNADQGFVLLQALEKAGITMQEVAAAASDLGISLSNPPTAKELIALQQALKSLAGQAAIAVAAFNAQIDIIKRGEQLGVITPDQGLSDTISAFWKLVASRFAEGLPGIDLSAIDTSSKAAFEASIGPIIAQLEAGGELSDAAKEFFDELQVLDDAFSASAAAAQAAADAFSQQVSDAFDAIGVEVKHGVLTAQQGLQAIIDAGASLFPALAKGLDTSSKEAFDRTVAPIIAGFASDGKLDQAEKDFLNWVDQVDSGFDAMDSAASDAATAFQQASDRFDASTEVLNDAVKFGLDASTALNLGIQRFRQDFPDVADLFDFSSLDAFKASVLNWLDPILASGRGLTDEEQKIVGALGPFIDAWNALGQSLDAASFAAQQLASNIDSAFKGVDQRTSILGESTLGQLQDLFSQFGGELGNVLGQGLLDGFSSVDDLWTPAGLATLKSRLQAAYEKLAIDGVDASEQPLVDLITRMIGLINDLSQQASDAITKAASDASQAIQDAFENLDIQFDIQGITDPLEQLVEAINSIEALDPRIAAALQGLDLTTQSGRDAALAALRALAKGSTDKDLLAEIDKLIHFILAVPAPGTGTDTSTPTDQTAGTGSSSANFAGAPTITSVQGDQLLNLVRTLTVLDREISTNTAAAAATLASLFGGGTLSLPTLQPPALPSQVSVASQSVSIVQHLDVNVSFDGVPADGTAAAQNVANQIRTLLRSPRVIEDIQTGLRDLVKKQNLSLGITTR